MYDLSDYQRAELLLALSSDTANVRTSELLGRRALFLPDELAKPSILFLFLTHLPSEVCALRCDRPTSKVFVATSEQDEPSVAIDSDVNALSGARLRGYCFYHQKWGSKARSL